MKIIKFILLIACILLLTSALALSEGFFTHSDEILFADQCPDGYQTVEKRLVLGQGETRVIANQAKYFGSHNHDIVAVSNDGVIQAVSPGRTVITVYLEYNVRKDLVAEVVKAPKTIRLSEKKGTLTIGGTHQLKPTITQSTATTITWTSSAPEIASAAQPSLSPEQIPFENMDTTVSESDMIPSDESEDASESDDSESDQGTVLTPETDTNESGGKTANEVISDDAADNELFSANSN